MNNSLRQKQSPNKIGYLSSCKLQNSVCSVTSHWGSNQPAFVPPLDWMEFTNIWNSIGWELWKGMAWRQEWWVNKCISGWWVGLLIAHCYGSQHPYPATIIRCHIIATTSFLVIHSSVFSHWSPLVSNLNTAKSKNYPHANPPSALWVKMMILIW